jgi:asparagine synthase (glutamine-hydrolysing)
LEETIRRSVGMFAYAVWDRQERMLTLVRDRLGIKPLYYGWVNSTFVFGSELKAFRTMPGFQNPIRRESLELFLRYNYIPAPYSIYERIFKLPPGTILCINPETLLDHPAPIPYWSCQEIAQRGQASTKHFTDQEAIDETEALLRESVGLCMVSDVPLGVFLSGGVDSSTVTALMQIQSTQPVRTFSIGFKEEDYNEAVYAEAIARHLGTEHTELYVSSRDVMDVIPRLPAIYDEPFADPSQIPTVLVSELARHQVTVSLSGDGGDELFGGYKQYSLTRDIWQKTAWLGVAGRNLLGKLVDAIPAQTFNGFSGLLVPLFDHYGRAGSASDKFYKLASILGAETRQELYDRILSNKWTASPSLVTNPGKPGLLDMARWIDLPDFVHCMMCLDTATYLPDDILVKLDRASMSVGLEGRLPLLDHRLVEFLWQLPLHMKTHTGQSKWLLKQVLYRHVPQEMMERPKKGFSIPFGDWLRGPLRDWAESLLAERRLKSDGYLHPETIRQHWSDHVSGRRNWSFDLWAVLMFQSWLECEQS